MACLYFFVYILNVITFINKICNVKLIVFCQSIGLFTLKSFQRFTKTYNMLFSKSATMYTGSFRVPNNLKNTLSLIDT